MQLQEHEIRIPAPAVAEAAGISLETLNNWLRPEREVITLALRSEGGGKGQTRMFGLRGAYQIALTAHLVANGSPPQAAARAALEFTAVGDESRGPGELFPKGETFLFVDHVSGDAHLVNWRRQSFRRLVGDLPPWGSQRDWHPIDVGRVVERVRHRLGLPRLG